MVWNLFWKIATGGEFSGASESAGLISASLYSILIDLENWRSSMTPPKLMWRKQRRRLSLAYHNQTDSCRSCVLLILATITQLQKLWALATILGEIDDFTSHGCYLYSLVRLISSALIAFPLMNEYVSWTVLNGGGMFYLISNATEIFWC